MNSEGEQYMQYVNLRLPPFSLRGARGKSRAVCRLQVEPETERLWDEFVYSTDIEY